MATSGFYPYVHQETFLFSDVPRLTTVQLHAVVRVTDRIGPLFGHVWCEPESAASLTLSVEQSNDNGASDPYATINMRIGGASVSSVTAVVGGRVVMALETQTKPYIRFVANRPALGQLILCGFNCRFERFTAPHAAL